VDNYAASDRFSDADKLALRYSELMATEPEIIDQSFFDTLRGYYSEEEIMELSIFIGFNLGFHTFFGTLKFYPMFSPDGRLVTQDESERIYGSAPTSLHPSESGK
jgi:hypothetical protein